MSAKFWDFWLHLLLAMICRTFADWRSLSSHLVKSALDAVSYFLED
ncbi:MULTISPECIES: hypothetical protein [unclassified Coleofasciculus]|nr:MULTISPECIES: hypothetical protein [unclassified Coleofasciculus]MBD2085595.1 hypothetical protein [Coleofasciculus sp. FACHB-542]MBD2538230.1 hypothetical protein [Coleofasciculus sp. FACHB-SPT36]